MDNSFLQIATHPFKLRLFLLTKLPSAFFSGVRVRYVDEQKAVVTVPYKWFTTNPFKSTYFACLSMAAEMSTGILAMGHTYKASPAVSMLVLKTEGNFHKKATGLTTFTCEDGHVIGQIIRECLASGKAATVTARSVGLDDSGNIIADFSITWSFRARTTQPSNNSDRDFNNV